MPSELCRSRIYGIDIPAKNVKLSFWVFSVPGLGRQFSMSQKMETFWKADNQIKQNSIANL
jgi:hypothetical protein